MENTTEKTKILIYSPTFCEDVNAGYNTLSVNDPFLKKNKGKYQLIGNFATKQETLFIKSKKQAQ